jgi:hypothetical protein
VPNPKALRISRPRLNPATVGEHALGDVVVEAHPRVPRVEGGIEMTMAVHGTVEVVSWVLSFGDHALVLEPSSLRLAVANELQAASAQYEGVNSAKASRLRDEEWTSRWASRKLPNAPQGPLDVT